MSNVFPSLSTDGAWMSNKNLLMEKLFEVFLSCDFSQSSYKDANSFKYILNQDGLEDSQKASEMKASLEELYGDYFTNLSIEVTYETNSDSVVEFKIGIVSVMDGQTYRLNEVLTKNFYSEVNKFDLTLDEVING